MVLPLWQGLFKSIVAAHQAAGLRQQLLLFLCAKLNLARKEHPCWDMAWSNCTKRHTHNLCMVVTGAAAVGAWLAVCCCSMA